MIAIFVARLGTPTGLTDFGTVEAVQRAMAHGIRMMVYFSDLVEPIKTKMKAMCRTNEDYYPQIADRLKIPCFTSLTDLSPTALEKVHDLVGRDARKKKGR